MAKPAYPLRLPTRLPVLWRLTVLSQTLGALLNSIWAWLQGDAFSVAPPALILASAVPLVLFWYAFFVARAGESGVKLFDRWGFAHRVDWDEIRSAEMARWPHMLFAPALRISSQSTRCAKPHLSNSFTPDSPARATKNAYQNN
ncbi:MAG: hypothetical protein RL227_1322, partial [Pseudomonadota bacterium]